MAVLGPGGVGGLLAALLARSGHRVVCLAGPGTADHLARHGLTVRSARYGDFTAPVAAGTELTEPVDACLIAVKHTALPAALDRIPAAALGEGLLVPLLNGIEHPALLRGRYAPERVVAAAIRVESTRTAPGVIEHTSPFAGIEAAVPAGAPAAVRSRLEDLAAALTAAGVRTALRDDEPGVLWSKMAFLAPLALLTTRHGEPAGGIRTGHREELRALLAETAAVSTACGAPAAAGDLLAFWDGLPAGLKSSMQRDAEAGRPLELDAIGGALLRAAARHGIAVPTAEALVTALADGPGRAGGR